MAGYSRTRPSMRRVTRPTALRYAMSILGSGVGRGHPPAASPDLQEAGVGVAYGRPCLCTSMLEGTGPSLYGAAWPRKAQKAGPDRRHLVIMIRIVDTNIGRTP